ncbi:MAG TPA: leucine--tRNA ligase [Gemmatimonadota bacterium]|nr:leucine--tRNA ligase [Gemmatimonadota bacterium]
MTEIRYDPREIEPRWRRAWEEMGLFRTDLGGAERPCYALVMLPYPSGDRLHVGHWYHYGPADSWARFMRMRERDVFEPIGFDAFGLPAENYAIRTGIHPKDSTDRNVANMIEQLRTMGAMWDWAHTANTSDPSFYRWTQWIFLELYRAGLAYRKAAPVWWCPTDQTVLANEQVVEANVCERCGTPVEKRDLTQWFFRITDYAEELLSSLDDLEWPERTKTLQRNWIGRSEGVEIEWPVEGTDLAIRTFTTRPDTIYGVTFLVLAPEHSLVERITTDERLKAVLDYRDRARRLSEIERTSTEAEKTGEPTGACAIHPLTGERIPIWVADFVLLTYGTGAVQGVPAHDERDYDFAAALDLPVRWVIEAEPEDQASKQGLPGQAYTGHGTVVDSGRYTGMRSEDMLPRVVAHLESAASGEARVHYRLRDWLVSRQRYWGAPIPIIHCEECGEVPIPDEDLPVELPYDVDFSLGAGKSPLERSESFMQVECPSCRGAARRDPDTMDTFVDSSWYFLRYLSPHDEERPWDRALAEKWCPVYQYSGGIEHSVLHLLYARFMVKALRDLGHLGLDEPFRRLVHQGTITNQGAKMSKSRDNVITPDSYIAEYGADAFRAYLMFGFAWREGGDWKDEGIRAIAGWLQRVWRLVQLHRRLWSEGAALAQGDPDSDATRALILARHRAVRGATEDLEAWQFNTAIARIMELVNACYQHSQLDPALRDSTPRDSTPRDPVSETVLREAIETVVCLLAPIAPHLAEELWAMIGRKPPVVDAPWPEYDPDVLATEEVTVVIQVNGKVRDEMRVARDLPEKEIEALALTHGRIPTLIDGKAVRKVVVVPNRLVNLVV